MGQERFGVIPSVMQFGYRTLREHGANARRRISRLAHGEREADEGERNIGAVGRRGQTRGEDKLKIKIPFET